MTQCLIDHSAAPRPSRAPKARIDADKWPALWRGTRTGALCALVGLASSALLAPTEASATPGVHPLAPGSVVVSQGGTIFGTAGSGVGTTVAENGEVDIYQRDANGDVAPEARFTNDMYGPVAMAFDPWGDLWTVNLNTGTVVELTRAQLGMPNPVPSVTITLPSGAVAVPTGMAFDPSGNLWVVDSGVSQIVEYTRGQLATSGSPTPQAIISKTIPGDPLGDMFDRGGNLWVTVQISSSCPQGCVVEFSRAELAMTNPTPTVTINSTGGANMAFTESGDMWMVTGGGAAVGTPGCFGTPCTNELVEFTRAQLRRSGAPTPAVTISTTAADASGTMFGPYGVAVTPSGDVWVSNFNKPTTVEYGKYQLSRSGSPIPMRTISGGATQMNWPSYVLVEP